MHVVKGGFSEEVTFKAVICLLCRKQTGGSWEWARGGSCVVDQMVELCSRFFSLGVIHSVNISLALSDVPSMTCEYFFVCRQCPLQKLMQHLLLIGSTGYLLSQGVEGSSGLPPHSVVLWQWQFQLFERSLEKALYPNLWFCYGSRSKLSSQKSVWRKSTFWETGFLRGKWSSLALLIPLPLLPDFQTSNKKRELQMRENCSRSTPSLLQKEDALVWIM